MITASKDNILYKTLYSIPENMLEQVIGNETIAMPRPSPQHANVVSGIGFEIGPAYRLGRGGPGGWIILDEPEICLGQNILVPDLAGWTKEKLSKFPKTNFITVAPDWICEVLSPRTFKIDRIKKMPIYAQFGVSFLWLIDPIEEIFEIFKLNGDKWTLLAGFAGNDKIRAEPFIEVEIDLANLWSEIED